MFIFENGIDVFTPRSTNSDHKVLQKLVQYISTKNPGSNQTVVTLKLGRRWGYGRGKS